MKAFKSAIVFLILICLGFALISCSKAESPVEPDSAANIISEAPDSFGAQYESRNIIGAYQVTVDPDLETLSISPVERTGSFHYKLTQIYPEVLTITAWGFTPNFWADIKLSHPLPTSGIDVFDPRVVAILPANDGVSVNFSTLDFHANNSVLIEPDGYTKLWDNSSIPGNANPFIAYFKEQPYRQWSSINPQNQTIHWEMDIDGFGGALSFELVVDISTNYPDEPYPYIDNVEEPFQIDLIIGDGLTDEGGSAPVDAIISDWQGESTIGGVSIEAPDLFEDVVNLDFDEQIDTFAYKYSGTISNELLASSGEYPVLVSSWDADTGIRAYNLFKANVIHSGLFNLQEVTPEFSSHHYGEFALHGDYAYVIGNEYDYWVDNELLIYDISDITNPQFISKLETSNEPINVVVKDNYLYLASYAAHSHALIEVMDISNPSAPLVVTRIDMDTNIWKLKIIDNYLYASNSSGLFLIDITTPALAHVVSQLNGTIDHFEVVGDHLFILADWDLRIYEFDPPYGINWIKTVWNRTQRGEFCINDGYAYIRDEEDQCINVIDIDPIEEASVVNTFSDLQVNWSFSNHNRLVTRGNYLYYLFTKSYSFVDVGLYICDITDRENPQLVRTLPISSKFRQSLSSDIEFRGDYLIFSSDEGLRVVDISTPASAFFVGEISNVGGALEAYPDGDYLYVATSLGLQILDISTPETAFCVKHIVSHDANDVYTRDGYAYLADGEAGLMIIDVDPVEDAHVTNTIDLQYDAHEVAIYGNYLYVYSSYVYSDLSIIDIEDPENALLINTIPIPFNDRAYDVDAVDGYVYMVFSDVGLHIVDVDPPESAFFVGALGLGSPNGVNVLGEYAFIAHFDNGLMSVNISNPASPYLVDSIGENKVYDVTISDGYAYIPHYDDGFKLQVVEISDPANMVILDECSVEISTVNVQNNYAYGTAFFCDLKIVKLW